MVWRQRVFGNQQKSTGLGWDNHDGIPGIFITALGIAKIAGVIVLLIPNKLPWLPKCGESF
jgi:hypothetical protein